MPYYDRDETLPMVTGARGHYVHTSAGRLLDLASGYWSVPLGHGYGPIRNASRRTFFADLSSVRQRAAEELCDRLCDELGYARAILLTSGSSAVDCALRISMQATAAKRVRRNGFVSLKGCFHGSTALGLAVAGAGFDHWLPDSFATVQKPGTWVFDTRVDRRTADDLIDADGLHFSSVSALIVEPIQGAGGVRELAPAAYEALAERCWESGGLVVADEVATGIGRAGYLCRSQLYGKRPDIVVLGKGITNGEAPLSVVLLSQSVVDRIEASTRHTSVKWLWGETYGGSVTGACDAAMQVLNILDDDFLASIRERSFSLGEYLRRQVPLGGAVSAVRTPPDAYMFGIGLETGEQAKRVRQWLQSAGIRVVHEGPNIVLMPMFTMSVRKLKGAFRQVGMAISKLT
jgi:adenosylmethionine-8-amino-7-oxononanoate aminotransferase